MTDEEYAELQQSDRKAQIREWSFVQFAPFWQQVMRVCVEGPSGSRRLNLECVSLWLTFLDHEVERIIAAEDVNDRDVQDGLLALTEAYIALEEARQVRKRRDKL